jgi:iron complex outermembrane receptor protein
MKVNKTPIAAAVTLTLMSAAFAVQAQTENDKGEKKKEDSTQLEQVVVTGIRASLQQSLKQKRNAESLVEVITAEDVGKMPDKNVADSLQRVPGVSTTSAGSNEGSFGENEHVQMRGIHSQYTLTTLNGHLVSTGDWYGPNISAGGRSVTFTLLPSDLVGRVIVHKSSQADLPEGGAAGTVDIQTRHPLDFKETFGGAVSAEVARSDAAKKNDPALTALLHWKNESNTFGILAQVFSQERHLQRAGSEGVWWDKYPANYPDPNLAGKNVSYLSGAVLFQQERKRQGGYLEAEFRPSNDLSFNLSGFYSKLDAKNYNTNFMAGLTNAANGAGWSGNYPLPSPGYTVSGNTVTSIFYPGNAFNGLPGGSAGAYSAVEDVAARPDAKTDSKFVNLDGKWVVNDKLTLDGKLGHTQGTGRTTDVGFELLSGWDQGAGYTLRPDGIFVLNVPGGGKFTPAGFGIGGWGSKTKSVDKETYGQIDATLKLDNEYVPSVRFGARATDHQRKVDRLLMTLAAGASDETQIPADAFGTYPAGWFGGLPANPTPGFLPFKVSNDYVAQWVAKYAQFNTPATQLNYDIKEDTQAAYVMANLQPSDAVSGNVGLRIVRTKDDIVAFLPGGLPRYQQSFTDLLPSLNLRGEFSKDLVGRFSLNRSMSRPDYGQLAGSELRDLQHDGSASNPFLKPTKATNLDLSLEWYFQPKSLLSVGAFASQLNGVIGYASSTMNFANNSKPGSPVEAYKVSTPTNTNGRLTGMEAQYQQALFGGFGLDANYTHTNGRITQKDAGGTCNGTAAEDCSLYGTSKDVYNLGAYYENDFMSARLAYSHRSAYKLGNRGGADYFQSANGQLNFALNINFWKDATFTFEAQNLTDPLLTVYKTDRSQVSGVYKAGKMYYAGLRYKF